MGEQIYSYGFLQDKVTGLLRSTGQTMTAEAISETLDLPPWAVEVGVETALHFKEIEKVEYGYRFKKADVAPAIAAKTAIKSIALEILL